MKIFGLTEQNRQPEPPARKPNEDRFACHEDAHLRFGIVMDGIPVLRDERGVYPEENGGIAAHIAMRAMTTVFTLGTPSERGLKNSFRTANISIWHENLKLEMYAKTPPYWLATVGCALWADPRNGTAFFGYIGDPLAFIVSRHRRVEIITRDQLAPSEGHFWAKHRKEISSQDPAANVFIREHQDQYIRNHLEAKCFCGERFCGWGALTGDGAAMDFVVTRVIETPPGTRVVMASDAMEAIGAGNGKERKPEDYREALLSTLGMNPEEAALELLRLTRAGEEKKRCKSDDATFVVVDF